MIKILGIESSCDDTGIAIVAANREILSNIVISQDKEHECFQGVVPEIAARAHLKNLEKGLKAVLSESQLTLKEIDCIAATSGPGLIGGVIVGSMFGRTLASVLKKPFIAVNHLEGHALTAKLTNDVHYPYLLLLISGGHSQFIAVRNLGQYKILGQTIDDSLGEAFDKVAKMLNLTFPGGPAIEERAKLGNPHKYIFPKPIINQNNCDMSFSGLKTAVRLLITKLPHIGNQEINDIAASFQQVLGEIILVKIQQAIIRYKIFIPDLPISTLVMAGGVAANNHLRTICKEHATRLGYNFIVPPTNLCTDNAAMIAFTGLEKLANNITSPLNFRPRTKWSLEDL